MLAEGPAQYFLQRGDDVVNVEDLRACYLSPGEGEQLAGQARSVFGGLPDLPKVAASRLQALRPVGFGRCAQFLRHERRVVEDHGEDVIEVVRDPACQLAEVLHALGLLQLLL